jgi:DNA-binding CsgD family transcriptional regulator
MRLFKKKKGKGKRAFATEVAGLRLSIQDSTSENEGGPDQIGEQTQTQDFEIFPADPAIRNQWFSLTVRERQIVALVSMGYRNNDIAAILGVEYATIQTHLQNIFRKFNLRSRKEIRAALVSWRAEEWWKYHHY